MGILNSIGSVFSKKDLNIRNEDEITKIGPSEIKSFEIGSSGTEIFSGYLTEEYLETLQGTQKADIYDKMRRSDAKVKMVLSAMKNPIKAASWEVSIKGDETKEALEQQALIEHILFNDIGKSWRKFLHEALSMIDFGFSLFEITYKPVLSSKQFGSYIGLKSLAFRSQRKIERWKMDRSGNLLAVEQQAYGDGQVNTDIPADFLLHFALEQEGDNFEGVSILRPCYGPWLRKNQFLKLIAAGIEKYAIPIPVLDVPEGKEQTEQYTRAVAALKKYVSHQCNYLVKPKGWDLELKNNPFDADKIRSVIDKENIEIVNAALANFLELGQSGSGSYALSFDLSDFFLGALEFIADEICEVVNTKLIPKLVELNFNHDEVEVELRCSGISDKAGEEFAKVISTLVRSNVIEPDERLEESIRKRFGLPDKDTATTREAPENSGGIFELAEKKDVKKKSERPVVAKQIEAKSKEIEEVLSKHLSRIQSNMIDRVERHFVASTKANKLKLPKLNENINGLNEFKKDLKEVLASTYSKGVAQVKNEHRRFKNVSLGESKQVIKLSEIDKLGPEGKRIVTAQATTLIETLVNDLDKYIALQYLQSAPSTDSPKQLRQDLKEASTKYVEGANIQAAAGIQSATVINSARKDFFDVINEEVVSYTWVNPDPQAEICKYLNGRTLPADHPDVERYQPPLHFNCKTFIVANTSTMKDNPEPQSGFKPNKKEMESINLSECNHKV